MLEIHLEFVNIRLNAYKQIDEMTTIVDSYMSQRLTKCTLQHSY